MPSLFRRSALGAALAAGLLAAVARRAQAAPTADMSLRLLALPVHAPMAQLQAGGPTGLLGVGRDGALWALSPAPAVPSRLADGLDPQTPLTSGHGRIAARTAGGGLWVFDIATGRAQVQPDAGLAPHAGLLVLPLAVLGVVAAGHRLVRFEPAADGRWQPVARSSEALLPDARPLQADLDGRGDGQPGGGHIVVLAGPDAQRYRHGVLGDAVEATRVLWLERHDLQVLRALELPAPHVFEDIAPRPVALPGRAGAIGLLTVRSGPDGGQLALLSADPAQPARLQLAALGEPVGGFHRWLAPTTDGRHLVAVHTPHIGGVLHSYHQDGPRLLRRRLLADVSTHHIGARETDLAVWLQGQLLVPSQDGRTLLRVNPARDWADEDALPLPARVVQTTALADGRAWAGLLDDGRVLLAQMNAAPPAGRR
jgi:hypothetical protein